MKDIYRTVDEPLELLPGQRIVEALRIGLDRYNLWTITRNVEDMRRFLFEKSFIEFAGGSVSLQGGSYGLEGHIGYEYDMQSGEAFRFSAIWDEGAVVSGILVDQEIYSGGRIIQEKHFGGGSMYNPELTGVPNTLSSISAAREMRRVLSRIDVADRSARRITLE